MKPYYRYWAKSKPDPDLPGSYFYHLLPYHCLDVAAVGDVLMENNPSLLNSLAGELGVPREELKKVVLFFLALHDLGKLSSAFQGQCVEVMRLLSGREEAKKYSHRHDTLGFLFWDKRGGEKLLAERFQVERKAPLKKFFKIFAFFSFGHHGMPPKNEQNSLDLFFDSMDGEACEMFIMDLFDFFNFPGGLFEALSREKHNHEIMKRFSWLLGGSFIVCDWIGSNDLSFPMTKEVIPLAGYWTRSLKLAAEALPGTGLIPAEVNKEKGMMHLFPQFAETPTPLQKFCDEVYLPSGPQLWILEDVTGAGKTEAALILTSRLMAAGEADGFFIGLPTMATSNAMYDRMAETYSRLFAGGTLPSLVLSHGSRHLSEAFVSSFRDQIFYQEGTALLSEDGRVQCARWVADSAKKAMLADVGVGTLDQVLLGVLPARHQSLRLYGMRRKILIVDEVHAYDPYMERLLQKVLQGHAAIGGSAILLSATMPQVMRKRLCDAFYNGLTGEEGVYLKGTDYPLVTCLSRDVKESGVATRKEVEREVELSFVEEERFVFRLIKRVVQNGECLCWIRNTIYDVMSAYNQLKSWPELGEEDLLIFHSRFTLKDRLAKEEEVLRVFGKKSTREERRGKILIASQVVEQSLDLDFDHMVSDLAPIDLLIQRAGRLHRHVRKYRNAGPVFTVFIPPDSDNVDWFSSLFPRASFVYPDIANLWRTKELLREEGKIRMPQGARHLIEGVYGAGKGEVPEVFLEAEGDSWSDRRAQNAMAEYNVLNLHAGFSGNSSDRWEEEKHIPTRLGEKQIKLYLARKSRGRLVPLYQDKHGWELSSLSLRKEKIKEIVLPEEDEKLVEALKKEGKMFYDWDFVLVPEERGRQFFSRGINGKDQPVDIVYDPRVGLDILEKEDE